MTPEQERLRKAVARALCSADAKKHGTVESVWKIYLPDADAAIAVALEQAAKVAEGTGRVIHKDPPTRVVINGKETVFAGAEIVDMSGSAEIAAAIRALIPSQSDKGEREDEHDQVGV